MVTRARQVGIIAWESTDDETRPVTPWPVHRTAGDFLQSELKDIFKGYWRDLLQSQPNQIEIVGEKLTIEPIIRQVAMEFCIPMTIARGFCSQPPMKKMADRYRQSGKEKLVLLFLSDFDPEGEELIQAFSRSMRDEFHISDLHPLKVALTREQVSERELPVRMQAKETSSRYAKFADKYGDDVYELEALAPEDLQAILRDAIDSVIDVDLFNKELDAEKQDAAFLK